MKETIEVQPISNTLILQIEQSGAELTTQEALKEAFLPFFEKAEEWKSKAEGLIVTDVSQIKEMKLAKEARLSLKDVRVSVEKKRKELKEDSLKKGKAIDGIASVLKNLIEPIEQHLEKQENFIAIHEAKLVAELKAHRLERLKPYEVNTTFYDLINMPESDFEQLVISSKISHENKQEETRKLEEQRLALQKKAQEEKVLADSKLKKEHEEKVKLQAELKAKEDEEIKRQQDILAKQEAELSMGDKEKFGNLISEIEVLTDKYSFKSKKYKALLSAVVELLVKVVTYAKSKY